MSAMEETLIDYINELEPINWEKTIFESSEQWVKAVIKSIRRDIGMDVNIEIGDILTDREKARVFDGMGEMLRVAITGDGEMVLDDTEWAVGLTKENKE